MRRRRLVDGAVCIDINALPKRAKKETAHHLAAPMNLSVAFSGQKKKNEGEQASKRVFDHLIVILLILDLQAALDVLPPIYSSR